MSPKVAMISQQFPELAEDQACLDYELDRGEMVKLTPSSAEHELIKCTIADVLGVFVREYKVGRILIEAGFQVDDSSWRRPDVAFLRNERIDRADRKRPFTGSPDLAIEVAYPSDSRRLLSRKVRHYLETGSLLVWVVFPASLEVNVISKSVDDWLGPDDTLDAPSVLPGFSVAVRSLFQ